MKNLAKALLTFGVMSVVGLNIMLQSAIAQAQNPATNTKPVPVAKPSQSGNTSQTNPSSNMEPTDGKVAPETTQTSPTSTKKPVTNTNKKPKKKVRSKKNQQGGQNTGNTKPAQSNTTKPSGQ